MEEKKHKVASQTRNINLRCSPEQHEKIFLNARLNKLNASQYILAKALNEDIRSPQEHEKIVALLQLKADLARLGNLFKLCLDKEQTGTDLFQNTLKDIKNLSSKIGAFLEQELK